MIRKSVRGGRGRGRGRGRGGCTVRIIDVRPESRGEELKPGQNYKFDKKSQKLLEEVMNKEQERDNYVPNTENQTPFELSE